MFPTKSIFFLALFSLCCWKFADAQDTTITLSHNQFDKSHKLPLGRIEGWVFKAGHDTSWVNPQINTSTWTNTKIPLGIPIELADKDGKLEGWFRLRFRLDSSFQNIPLEMTALTWNASDVYINGKLVHSFGNTGVDETSFQNFNPNKNLRVNKSNLIPLSLEIDKEYLLAVHVVHFINPFFYRADGKLLQLLPTFLNLTAPGFLITYLKKAHNDGVYLGFFFTILLTLSVFIWLLVMLNRKERHFISIALAISCYAGISLFFYSLTWENISYNAYNISGIFFALFLSCIFLLIPIITSQILRNKISRPLRLLLGIFASIFLANLFLGIGVVWVLGAVISIILTTYLVIISWASLKGAKWALVIGLFSSLGLFLLAIFLVTVVIKDTELGDRIGGFTTMLSILAFPFSLLVYVSIRFKETILDAQTNTAKVVQVSEEKAAQLQKINVASAKFVPSTFLNFLGKENILDATLGDYVEKQVSVLFSDIRDYTTLSDQMTPEENFRFVNAYNRRMGPIIQQHQGFVNQYLGDGLMAIFPEHTEGTLKAAIAMQQTLQDYNQQRIAKNKIPIRMGIGIHAGPLIMGIIGDDQRMDAATISDTVNAASRVEGLTKYFGANILLSEAVVENLPNRDLFNLRYLGLVQVKGKQEIIKIYECFDGDSAEMLKLKRATIADFEKGMDSYYQKEFKAALSFFENVVHHNSKDGIAQFFITKTKHLIKQAIPKDWTGVEMMDNK